MTDKQYILIVDDHAATRETIRDIVEIDNVVGHMAKNVAEAFEKLEQTDYDLVITDLRLPDRSGINVLERSIELYPDTPVVIITGFGSEATAVDAMKKGAHDYLTKPLDLPRMRSIITNALRVRQLRSDKSDLERRIADDRGAPEIISASAQMERIKKIIRQVGPTDATVLLTGESGVGKEVVANSIQASSARSGKPFIKVNAAALPRDLLESELFGHERGAFTGAYKRKKGRFELANGGTLFLDEIGEMPVETQVKLLRVLQEGQFERVGGTDTIRTDARLICATNRDLETAIADGRFRSDLYYRINVIKINIPPLRERSEDILPLSAYFLKKFCSGATPRILPDAMDILYRHPWYGNIRELENVIQRAVLLSGGDPIDIDSLPPELVARASISAQLPPPHPSAPVVIPSTVGIVPSRPAANEYGVGQTMEAIERKYILETLEANGGNKSRAAKQLDIGLKTLYRKLQKYGVE